MGIKKTKIKINRVKKLQNKKTKLILKGNGKLLFKLQANKFEEITLK
jgi:hypothetical protein